MIRKDVKSTRFFYELDEFEREKFFDYKSKKFIHNIDSLYYSVFIKDDSLLVNSDDDTRLIDFIFQIKQLKEQFIKTGEQIYINKNDDLIIKRSRFAIYDLCISVNNKYDYFIASSLPNENTPRIVCQIRSIPLWLLGDRQALECSYEVLKRLLNQYQLEVSKVQENRIDYAFHTNVIQNTAAYFSDTVVSNIRTSLKIYNKVGQKDGKNLTVDYLSLGNRKSNNLFFRTYNKSLEVVQENYKGFFIDLWYKQGLISYYDKFVYEYAYKKGSWASAELGKLEFYIKFGKSNKIKKNIALLIYDPNSTMENIRTFANDLMPKLTIIMNIEYQTMRKFYTNSDNLINILMPGLVRNNELIRIFKIIDNRKVFLDYLTEKSVCFMKNENEISDWWKGLRRLKLDYKTNSHFHREYDKQLDIDKLKLRLKGTVASLNMYLGNDKTDFNQDLSNVLCVLNDNDVKNNNFNVISDYGEIIDFNNKNNGYKVIKEKKKKALCSIINMNKKLKSKTN